MMVSNRGIPNHVHGVLGLVWAEFDGENFRLHVRRGPSTHAVFPVEELWEWIWVEASLRERCSAEEKEHRERPHSKLFKGKVS